MHERARTSLCCVRPCILSRTSFSNRSVSLTLQEILPVNCLGANYLDTVLTGVGDEIQYGDGCVECSMKLRIWNLLVIHVFDGYSFPFEELMGQIVACPPTGYIRLSSQRPYDVKDPLTAGTVNPEVANIKKPPSGIRAIELAYPIERCLAEFSDRREFARIDRADQFQHQLDMRRAGVR